MQNALKTLRVVQWAMLGSILLYARSDEFVRPSSPHAGPCSGLSVYDAGRRDCGMIFVVRRTLVFRAAESLSTPTRRHPKPKPLEDGILRNVRAVEAWRCLDWSKDSWVQRCSRAFPTIWVDSSYCSSSGRRQRPQGSIT